LLNRWRVWKHASGDFIFAATAGGCNMNAIRKPRGKSPNKPDAEITKLKQLWGDPCSNIDRLYWRKLFLSCTTQAEIRREISERLNIHLDHDARLTSFRQWLEESDNNPKEPDFII